MPGGNLGFVDDCLDNFHSNTYLAAIRGELAGRGWSVAGATALQMPEGVQWAERNSLVYYDSVDQLASNVDAIAILAPSTPATHWRLCKMVLPHGKPTFVDKTFAINCSEAQQIFDLADQHGAAIQSTSALRSTNVQAYCRESGERIRSITVWAGGDTFAEYGVHPIELAVSSLDETPSRMAVISGSPWTTILLEFSRGRTATIHFNASEHLPFEVLVESLAEKRLLRVDDSVLFVNAARCILDFFDAGRALVPREQTMAIMRVLDATRAPEAASTWLDLEPHSG
ncbi:Oxidoreductase family, NAD-binding Rossmann fold [Posidoniimonas corsicana]|uniref:Oxidoreductase family, NAD-binding Rossmann fold n=1 Tax=Posidoniimonas corsicana TaxID=1938618 RepID=A0A5C5VBG8_9BACT|nr:Gfo/Idh/MocA family oxidoreductase [Posidoniimonas corsicana]TWT35631.1 Oxidoreductase family, NAD-binding Rossmann fold [Posidoniimonas corsicana]